MLLRNMTLCLCLGALAHAEVPAPFPLADVPVVAPDKKTIDLKQYRGKALVVVMISTSCKHCIDAVQDLMDLQARYSVQGLQVVGIAGDPNSDVAVPAFIERYHPNFPFGWLAKDPFLKLANLPPDGRPFAPIVLFADPRGMVRNRMFGNDAAMKNTEAALADGVRDLLAKSGYLPKK